MKSQAQGVALIVVLVALVGGVTFVRQWMPSADDPTKPVTPDVTPASTLFTFLVTAPEGFFWEHGKKGHFDFWFENRNPKPQTLTLTQTSCVCTEAQIGFLDGVDWSTFQLTAPVPGACQTLVSPGRSLDLTALAIWSFLETKPQWTPMRSKPAVPVTVPAAPAKDRPALGVVRFIWDGRKEGPQRLTAELTDEAGGTYGLEVRVNFVPPVFAYPKALRLPDDLQAGSQDKRTVEMVCWSSTRPWFSLGVKEKDDHPCFVCRARPLPASAVEKLVTERRKEAEGSEGEPPAVMSGYLVTVDVYEHRNGRQLDFGPFRNTVDLQVDREAQTFTVPVTGQVRGDEVNVVAGYEVNLHGFWADEGRSETVRLQSLPGLELKPEDRFPDYLDVSLKPSARKPADGRKLWDLTVSVPPNRPAGLLPADSAVVLKVEGSGRRFRIPVLGNAKTR